MCVCVFFFSHQNWQTAYPACSGFVVLVFQRRPLGVTYAPCTGSQAAAGRWPGPKHRWHGSLLPHPSGNINRSRAAPPCLCSTLVFAGSLMVKLLSVTVHRWVRSCCSKSQRLFCRRPWMGCVRREHPMWVSTICFTVCCSSLHLFSLIVYALVFQACCTQAWCWQSGARRC